MNLSFKIFIVVAIIQLLVPVKMIFDKESTLKMGKEYHFRTAPVDPNDPFRGKYLDLDFTENSFYVDSQLVWNADDDIYVSIATDSNGFAKIINVSQIQPADNDDFIKTKIRYVSNFDSVKIIINYPFERFYMDEFEIADAEYSYNQNVIDTSKICYAIVKVNKGDAVIEDLIIDNKTVKEIVNERKKQ